MIRSEREEALVRAAVAEATARIPTVADLTTAIEAAIATAVEPDHVPPVPREIRAWLHRVRQAGATAEQAASEALQRLPAHRLRDLAYVLLLANARDVCRPFALDDMAEISA